MIRFAKDLEKDAAEHAEPRPPRRRTKGAPLVAPPAALSGLATPEPAPVDTAGPAPGSPSGEQDDDRHGRGEGAA